MQGEKCCAVIGLIFPKVASFTMTYQLTEAGEYINTLTRSRSWDPNAGLSFAVLRAAIVTHMRWESPAIRYELIVGRTVNVVTFDVVRLL